MTRSPLLLAAVGAALALGACGSSDDATDSTASGAKGQDKAFEGALKFSKCMRDHGIGMPDPQRVGKGGIKLSGGKANFNDPKMKSAQSACQKYMQIGGGETIDPAKRAKLQEAALSYARCMRGQGVDMPDPKLAGNGGLSFQAGPGPGPKSNGSGGKGLGVSPDSPKFQAADKACNHLLGDRGGPGASTEEEK
jgi:ABC-type glycerol-3-phosphate transport system substrate-binding protein